MFQVIVDKLGTFSESEYSRVIVASCYKGKWIFSKHKERDTWEIPCGHVEEGEDWLTTAKRELYEETGITKAKITPVCVYKISKPGLLCYAEVEELGKLPEDFEMEKIWLFDDIPQELTYPEIHTVLFTEVKKFLQKNKK